MLMSHSFVYVSLFLVIGISIIVLLTTKFKVHPFFALLLASFVVGLGIQLPLNDVISTMKDGFGSIMKSIGLIIVLGTTLGVILEHTGSTKVMASYILKTVGEKYSALAMSITGFIVGMPIFCDSGFIVLSGLSNSLARRTAISAVVMSVCLATGLYSVHCLIPPHPGASAAAGLIGVDFGKLILIGILVAIPATIVGFLWANFTGKKLLHVVAEKEITVEENKQQPSPVKAFLPVIIPIVLIALKSFLTIEVQGNDRWLTNLLSIGDPVAALCIGILLAFNCKPGWSKTSVSSLLHDAAEKAGGILVIIAAQSLLNQSQEYFFF